MRILITAGPTREPLDAVRFLTNAATGRLGIEIAEAAVRAGHDADLVLGPTHLDAPQHSQITVRRVTTALEMLAACEAAWPACDALIATAAVSDWRPAAAAAGKPDKASTARALDLVPNPDIVATLAATKGSRPVIGFALQVEDAVARARAKLVRKGLDAIVLDSPAALGADRADFTILRADGSSISLPGCTKRDLATRLVTTLLS
jgi:phosphopantothenoylcysteine decarboxylase/phosphopantothenate--cysteine ligase